jgi:aspartate carbamoyltransferase regulatory subunit
LLKTLGLQLVIEKGSAGVVNQVSDYKEISELKIYKNDVYAGILKRTNEGCIFQLDSEFLQKLLHHIFLFA